MPANCYKRGKLLQQFHGQNADGISSAGDNLSMASNSQANQQNQTEVLPAKTTLKRKAALLEQTNVPQNKSAKRSNQKAPKVRAGTPLLLKYLKEWKVSCDCTISF